MKRSASTVVMAPGDKKARGTAMPYYTYTSMEAMCHDDQVKFMDRLAVEIVEFYSDEDRYIATQKAIVGETRFDAQQRKDTIAPAFDVEVGNTLGIGETLECPVHYFPSEPPPDIGVFWEDMGGPGCDHDGFDMDNCWLPYKNRIYGAFLETKARSQLVEDLKAST
jgi:hypothetical protein